MACSMLASPNTIIGPLPPSSSITCLPAARRATDPPVAVEPTKPTPSTSGWPATSSPTSAPGPVTRLTAPGGRSASAMHSMSATEITLVEDAGVQTTVLPPARAGAISSVAMVSGQFQGVITAYTPRGTRLVNTSLLGLADGSTLPSRRFRSSAAIRKYSAASSTSPYASAISGLPWSSVRMRARSSRRRWIASAMRCSRRERSKPLRPASAAVAPCAASTASLASALVPSGTCAMTAPVAGLTASKWRPLSESTQAPLTNILRSERATSTVISGCPAERPARRSACRRRRPRHGGCRSFAGRRRLCPRASGSPPR